MEEGAKITSHRLTQLTTTSFGPVYDLFLKFRSYGEIKLIIVAFEDAYCPVYLHVFSKNTHPVSNDSFVVPMEGLEIVASEMRMSGTGAFVEVAYFLIDSAGIRKLHTEPGLEQALSEILPEGHHSKKNDGFDIWTLTYRRPVWREEDANCCPFGGFVEIDFRLKDDQLAPIQNVYFPSGERPSD